MVFIPVGTSSSKLPELKKNINSNDYESLAQKYNVENDEDCLFHILREIGDPNAIQYLLDKGAVKFIQKGTAKTHFSKYDKILVGIERVIYYNFYEITPLMMTCGYQNDPIVLEVILRNGGDKTIGNIVANRYGSFKKGAEQNALIMAIKYKRPIDFIRILLENGADKYLDQIEWTEGTYYYNAIMYSFYNNMYDVFELLLQYGAGKTLTQNHYNDATMLEYMLNRRAAEESQQSRKPTFNEKLMKYISLIIKYEGDKYFKNVISVAISNYCDYEIIELLVKNGKNAINDMSSRATAICTACSYYRDEKIIKLLLNNGADVRIVSGYYQATPLINLVQVQSKYEVYRKQYRYPNPQLVKLILNAAGDVDSYKCVQDKDGFTALMHICTQDDDYVLDIVKMLVHKEDPSLKLVNKNKENALMIALEHSSDEVVQYLLDNGAHKYLAQKNLKKMNAVVLAAKFQPWHILESILKYVPYIDKETSKLLSKINRAGIDRVIKSYIANEATKNLIKVQHHMKLENDQQLPFDLLMKISTKVSEMPSKLALEYEKDKYHKMMEFLKTKNTEVKERVPSKSKSAEVKERVPSKSADVKIRVKTKGYSLLPKETLINIATEKGVKLERTAR